MFVMCELRAWSRAGLTLRERSVGVLCTMRYVNDQCEHFGQFEKVE